MSLRLFIASLGNPGPAYQNTLHSAGHRLLSCLQRQQHPLCPRFAKSRLHANGLISRGDTFTLWQSPALMNLSGPGVATAWRAFLRDLSNEDRPSARLVVVHDELESALGTIKVRNGGSAHGHNGLKSVISSLGGMEFMRIGVGIGRPDSRHSKDVADYVLKKMSAVEAHKISDAVDQLILELIKIRGS